MLYYALITKKPNHELCPDSFRPLVITGILYAIDVLKFRKLRAKNAKEPVWVEWGASFFPVILIVFVLRSFLFEPFKIPSG